MEIDNLRRWIGSTETAEEMLSPEMARRFEATFDRDANPDVGDNAPLLIHLCLAHPALPMGQLGRDGHPDRGGFLPPVPLPRRMWAGGAFAFNRPFHVGDTITRKSTVRDVVIKQGRTGTLCFVTVGHDISSGGQLLLSERQDIVYRGTDQHAAAPVATQPAPAGLHQRRVTPTPTMLFRYSALTFNGHRIHYDAPYARDIEGYPTLVVHGPMLATLLCQFAADLLGRPPGHFEFRSTTTLFEGREFGIHARESASGLRLWAASDGGPIAMNALAS